MAKTKMKIKKNSEKDKENHTNNMKPVEKLKINKYKHIISRKDLIVFEDDDDFIGADFNSISDDIKIKEEDENTDFECDGVDDIKKELPDDYQHDLVNSKKTDKTEDLYVDHDIKPDIVIGPEKIQKNILNNNNNLCYGTDKQLPAEPKERKSSIKTTRTNMSCEICAKTFSTLPNLSRHMHLHQTSVFQCKYCPKTFKQKYYLKNHIKIHLLKAKTLEKVLQCDGCDKVFADRSNYRRHVQIFCKISTKNRSKKKILGNLIECDICSKKVNEKSMPNHIKWSHSIKKFECDECGRKHVDKKDLARHIGVHTKQFTCVLCKKKYASTYTLNRHIKINHFINHSTKN